MRHAAFALAILAGVPLAACSAVRQESGVAAVEPAKPVDLTRYAGRWYEQGRYDVSFQRGCEAVTADYALNADGTVAVVNTCRQGAVDGPERRVTGTARVVEGSRNAKLKVAFSSLFAGDYWVLDRAPDYAWAIVGDGTAGYLWLLTRERRIGEAAYRRLVGRAAAMGYDPARIRRTAQ